MRVHCGEGVANHIGPEPCARVREDVGEASAGERRPAIEPRNRSDPECRRCLLIGRQHGRARYCECPSDSAWSKTLACAEVPCAGTGRSLDRP